MVTPDKRSLSGMGVFRRLSHWVIESLRGEEVTSSSVAPPPENEAWLTNDDESNTLIL